MTQQPNKPDWDGLLSAAAALLAAALIAVLARAI